MTTSIAAVGGVLLDVLDGAQLARPHDLVLVEQEDRHAGGVQQLLDLRPAGAVLGSGPAGHGGLPDAVRLVEDQDVEVVGLRGHERVEVL